MVQILFNSREAVSLPPMIMLETKTVARKTSDPTMKATREKKTAPLKVPNTRNPSDPANHWKGKESFGFEFFPPNFFFSFTESEVGGDAGRVAVRA